MGDYRTLFAYQKAFTFSMKLFNRSKKFPPEEKFGLMVQIRNSSRSVCVNIVEAYKRRRYKDFFTSKLNDAETENAETQVWLDFASACQ
jgi:four helix bundle protein